MAFDYTGLVTTASELISEFGRTVTFRRIDQAAGNAAKPWEGPSDPAVNPANTADVAAVFVPPSSAKSLGMSTVTEDMLATVSEIAIVEVASFDLATANEIQDNGQRKAISFVETLRPADTTLLYYVGVKR